MRSGDLRNCQGRIALTSASPEASEEAMSVNIVLAIELLLLHALYPISMYL